MMTKVIYSSHVAFNELLVIVEISRTTSKIIDDRLWRVMTLLVQMLQNKQIYKFHKEYHHTSSKLCESSPD